MASAAGVGVNRTGPFESTAESDAEVTTLALAHQRMYPVFGLPCASGGWDCSDLWSPSPSVAAIAIGPIVQAFAQRYGPNGSFWAANPQLPYLPVQSFEIGNEENLPTQWLADNTHMHWAPNAPSDPGAAAGAADYAMVYEAAWAALHQVDPSGIAVVGGLTDGAGYGVDLQSDEQYLDALTPGEVDAVGYHDWVFEASDSLLETDTADLRVWMDQNGFAGVPINVTEFGACEITPQVTDTGGCNEQDTQSDATWAPYAASYVQWAMCTNWLDVTTVIAFWWGDNSTTDQSVWLPLMSADGTLTDYGQAFLNDAESLTTTGCPPSSSVGTTPANTALPTVQGTAVSGDQLTAAPGTWSGDPAPTLSYQWKSCDASGQNCSSIVGADATTYTVQPTDVGSTLIFSVTAINATGGAVADSQPIAVSAGPSGTTTTGPSGTTTAGPSGTTTAGPSGTTTGNTSAPPSAYSIPLAVSTSKPTTPRLLSMDLRILRVTRQGRFVTIEVRYRARSGTVSSTAIRFGRRSMRIHLKGHSENPTTMIFSAQLPVGRWSIDVTGRPARGYAVPEELARLLTIARSTRVTTRTAPRSKNAR